MTDQRPVLTPSQVGQYIKGFMDRDRVLSGLLVRGEISQDGVCVLQCEFSQFTKE